MTYLPKDTSQLIFNNKLRIDNFNLKFNKYPEYDEEKQKFLINKYDEKKQGFLIEKEFSFNKDILKLLVERNEKIGKEFEGRNYKVIVQKFQTKNEMIIGFGTESVYETGMTLHHIFGISYIPGQALKGVVRNYIIGNFFEKKEEDALKDELFCYIFGSSDGAFYQTATEGNVMFFDAYPITPPTIKVDILNPHYEPYYSDIKNEQWPVDTYSPLPVFFLTVKKDVSFQILLVGKKDKQVKQFKTKLGKEGNVLDLVYENLKNALKENGIGAKTSVGYGRMQPI